MSKCQELSPCHPWNANQALSYLSGELRDTLSQMPRMSSQFSDVRFSFVAAADNRRRLKKESMSC